MKVKACHSSFDCAQGEACMQEVCTSITSCEDAEETARVSVAGELAVNTSRGKVSLKDSCLNTTTLLELSCVEGELNSFAIPCPGGCSEGVCLECGDGQCTADESATSCPQDCSGSFGTNDIGELTKLKKPVTVGLEE